MNKISLVGLFVLGGLTLGCPAAKDVACQIIKTAADVCTVIEYVGEDGKTYRVKVSKEEVAALALDAAKRDGVPGPAGVKPAAPVTSAAPTSVAAPPAPAPVVSAAPAVSAAPKASAAPAASVAPAPKAKK